MCREYCARSPCQCSSTMMSTFLSRLSSIQVAMPKLELQKVMIELGHVLIPSALYAKTFYFTSCDFPPGDVQ